MSSVTFVAMTWNRGGQRVSNLLASVLIHQYLPAAECIIVDTSNDQAIAQDIARTCRKFDRAKLIQRPQDTFRKSWALNVGVQAAAPTSRWVATTDIDFIFGRNMTELILQVPANKRALLTVQPMRLPEGADLSEPFGLEQWDDLCMTATWWGPSGGPGALQCGELGWWYRVRGYDERFTGGLGGPDTDLLMRAKRDSIAVVRFPFDTSRAIHQWHAESPMKHTTNYLMLADPPVVANPDGWGDL